MGPQALPGHRPQTVRTAANVTTAMPVYWGSEDVRNTPESDCWARYAHYVVPLCPGIEIFDGSARSVPDDAAVCECTGRLDV